MLQYITAGKRYGTRWAPVRFSLNVVPGEAVWLSGRVGSGKSTIVRMALGRVGPDSGSVLVGGVNIARASYGARQGIRRTISAILEDDNHAAYSAETWLATGLWCAGRPWSTSVKTAREALEKYGLTGEATRPFNRLGREARFALQLVRALRREPRLLLVDWAGAFAGACPPVLVDDFVRFIASGGTSLITGTMTEPASRANGRQESVESGSQEA